MSEPKKQAMVSWSGVLAIVITVIVTAAGQIYAYGGLNARVAGLEARTAPLTDGTLARLDERTASISKTLERLERRDEAARGDER